jgi:hypothetical protein
MTMSATGQITLDLLNQTDGLPPGIAIKQAKTKIQRAISASPAMMLKEISGSYSPNNDYKDILVPGIGEQPNLILFLSDKPVGFGIQSALMSRVQGLVVNGIFILNMKDWDQPITRIYLEGRPSLLSSTVPQNEAVSYYCALLRDS